MDEEYKAQQDILSAEYWDNRDALDAKLMIQMNLFIRSLSMAIE